MVSAGVVVVDVSVLPVKSSYVPDTISTEFNDLLSSGFIIAYIRPANPMTVKTVQNQAQQTNFPPDRIFIDPFRLPY